MRYQHYFTVSQAFIMACSRSAAVLAYNASRKSFVAYKAITTCTHIRSSRLRHKAGLQGFDSSSFSVVPTYTVALLPRGVVLECKSSVGLGQNTCHRVSIMLPTHSIMDPESCPQYQSEWKLYSPLQCAMSNKICHIEAFWHTAVVSFLQVTLTCIHSCSRLCSISRPNTGVHGRASRYPACCCR